MTLQQLEERHERLDGRVKVLEADKNERDIREDERKKAEQRSRQMAIAKVERRRAWLREFGGIIGMAVGLATLTVIGLDWWYG